MIHARDTIYAAIDQVKLLMRDPSLSWPPKACHRSRHISMDCSLLVFSSATTAWRVTPLCVMVMTLAHRLLSWSDGPWASKIPEGRATRGRFGVELGKKVLRPQAPDW